jgi:rhodanese-related sulfurtransferase
MGTTLGEEALSAEDARVAIARGECQVLDLRGEEEFAEAHIAGALNAPEAWEFPDGFVAERWAPGAAIRRFRGGGEEGAEAARRRNLSPRATAQLEPRRRLATAVFALSAAAIARS